MHRPRVRHQWKNQVWVGLVALALGGMIAFSWRAQSQARQVNPTQPSQQVQHQLQSRLALLQQENASLKQQVDEVQSQLAQHNQSAARQASMKPTEEALQAAQILAGTVAVRGAGVLVTVNDAATPPPSNSDPTPYLVHDYVLQDVVNELRAGGAEAIAVNGRRLTGISAIYCVGPTIYIGGVAAAPPYTIEAIGDPDTLMSALKMYGGVIDEYTHNGWQLRFDVKKMKEINLPAAIPQK